MYIDSAGVARRTKMLFVFVQYRQKIISIVQRQGKYLNWLQRLIKYQYRLSIGHRKDAKEINASLFIKMFMTPCDYSNQYNISKTNSKSSYFSTERGFGGGGGGLVMGMGGSKGGRFVQWGRRYKHRLIY